MARGAALLGALLAGPRGGAGYLPLEPNSPAERLVMMLDDSRPVGVLTQRALRGRLPAAAPAIAVERGRAVAGGPAAGEAGGDGAAPAGPWPADRLAYVIYTSGTTGRPKGVMISHRALAVLTETAARAFGMAEGERMLQFASISFDASVEEIFPALTRGATLVVRTDDMLGSTGAFLDRCRAEQITTLDLPTAYWHELAGRLPADGPPPALRLAIVGGERALPEHTAAWRAWSGPGVALLNTYGPTENTVDATLGEAVTDGVREVPIGRPIRGVRALVLDRDLEPPPPGAAGELCLAGSLVARGYLGRPALTAERFVPSPYPETPGERLYRTGDLTRHLADGSLEFVGRVDHQVKVRGFRVELAEIEAVLRSHPGVAEAVVLAPPAAGGHRLVAYTVPAGDSGPGPAELRGFLERRLPDYMVPAAWAELEAMPLSTSGKVDRRALEALEAATVGGPREVAAGPATPPAQAAGWGVLGGGERVGAPAE
jgi:amino acid adenylation domain-containing protein